MADTDADVIARVRARYAGKSIVELNAAEQDALGLCQTVENFMAQKQSATRTIGNLTTELSITHRLLDRIIDRLAGRDD